MQYWLMKTEPECFSIDDLKRMKKDMWDGVRNYQVRNMMRDDMKVGDQVLIYHSNSRNETGVAGVGEIASEAYPDPTQFDLKSEHPDPKSDPENPRWLVVDVKYKNKFNNLVSLQEIKLDPKFYDMLLIKKGNRLSVMPVKKKHFTEILKLGNK